GEQYGIILDRINFKDDQPLLQQVEVLRCVEQVIKFAALVIRAQHVQEIVDVKILFLYPVAFQYPGVVIPQERIETVEAGEYFFMLFQELEISRNGIGQRHVFAPLELLIVFFPERKQQRLDAFLLLRVQAVAFADVKGIEADGVVFAVREIIAVYHIDRKSTRLNSSHVKI